MARSSSSGTALAIGAVLIALAFAALGGWQLQRRAWKHELIERVAQRVRAPASEAPGPERWSRFDPADEEYRHVRVTGTLLHAQATLVQASTLRGPGFWLLTPLRRADGSVVLVNRGFVEKGVASASPPGERQVTGLLRLSEPGGSWPRSNDADARRWFSRDVQAIAAAAGLQRVAPYFIDADAASATALAAGPDAPVGGLTVIQFPDNHLLYALTWLALAAMALAAGWRLLHEPRIPRPQGTQAVEAHD